MAVPSYRRNSGELVILTKSLTLSSSVIRLVKNEKIIGKKNSRLFAEPFMTNLRSVLYNVSNANELNTKNPTEKALRTSYQYAALASLNRLYVDVRILIDYTENHSCKKLEDLLILIGDVKTSLKHWIISDNGSIRRKKTEFEEGLDSILDEPISPEVYKNQNNPDMIQNPIPVNVSKILRDI